jgi:hypothetical protein
METKSKHLILFFLIIFAVYCSITQGMSWDEPNHYANGKNRLRYLFSLGNFKDYDIFFWIKYYPGLYDTLSSFVSQMIPIKYEVYAHHLINLFFSFSALIAVSQITRIIFNRKVSKIVFFIAFLNPIFFGHMSMNPKDTIIAFSYAWSIYLILRYFKYQHIKNKRNYYSLLLGIVIGLGSGVRSIFIFSLFPIILIIIFEFFLKKENLFKKKLINLFFLNLGKIFFVAYILMILCWPNTHSNIFVLPFKLALESVTSAPIGTSWGLLNGEFYETSNTPKSYLVINFLYKLPEYILITYIIFVFLIFKEKLFFNNQFENFNKKIFYLLFIILFPLFLAIFASVKIFDGLRYFLYLIPFFCIIPSLVIYYLINHTQLFLHKLFSTFVLFFFLFFLFKFFSLTPYHYTYLNIFNGKFPNASKRFENDYWGVSIKELVKKIEKSQIPKENKNYKIAFCGINYEIASYYLSKINNLQFIQTSKDENYDYIIMTNRHNGKNDDKISDVKTCFDSYEGKYILSVKRNGLVLSTIMQKL